MRSNFTGILVAILVLVGIYSAYQFGTGKPVFGQERLGNFSEVDLRTAAEDLTSRDQIEAILQLGVRPGDLSKTVPVLAKLATIHNEMIKNAADSSLQVIGADAAEHIRPFMEENTTKGYQIACSALRSIGPESRIYIEELKDLLRDDNPIHRKCGLYALQGMGDEARPAMEEIILCVLDQDLNNQCMACRILENFGPDAIDAEEALLEVQKNGGPSTRGWAALCLGAIGPTSSDVDVAELLTKQLQPRKDGRPISPIEQQRVLTGLGYLGPEATKAIPTVREKLNGKNEFVQGHAAFALWKITGDAKEAGEAFRKLLNDPSRVNDAVFLIGKMGPDAISLAPNVAKSLRSSQPSTRELAATAIGNMGSDATSYRSELKPLLNDSDPLVRMAARTAMQTLKQEN
jgi:HEAT repeat protein